MAAVSLGGSATSERLHPVLSQVFSIGQTALQHGRLATFHSFFSIGLLIRPALDPLDVVDVGHFASAYFPFAQTGELFGKITLFAFSYSAQCRTN